MVAVKEIDDSLLAEWQSQGEPLRLVDVRSAMETARGVIAGTELMPLHVLPLKLQDFTQANVGEKAVIYCRTGARSYQACVFLMQHGVNNVYNLRGGVMAWVSNGKALILPDDNMSGVVG